MRDQNKVEFNRCDFYFNVSVEGGIPRAREVKIAEHIPAKIANATEVTEITKTSEQPLTEKALKDHITALNAENGLLREHLRNINRQNQALRKEMEGMMVELDRSRAKAAEQQKVIDEMKLFADGMKGELKTLHKKIKKLTEDRDSEEVRIVRKLRDDHAVEALESVIKTITEVKGHIQIASGSER